MLILHIILGAFSELFFRLTASLNQFFSSEGVIVEMVS